ncbi:transcriptional regulator [Streptomyces sp. ERV7]|uniref:TetR/AcrR family transcriptional regulator n=1 Tax=Streptomyces sp. ERV7 TaxID=1322334 RepID=UPI0007F3E3C4|nr:TetR/AcrR family transcriptional regulator [Streptomyces sp. ERV7]OAR24590.1 transcriptional regulator [Streptomyces sp. ERV7]
MGRPRQFDERQAVAAACQAFWAKGYEATSTQDLCEATGLGRSSIYNTFTSKDHLFRRALGHYIDTMTARQIAILEEEGGSGLERIRALFAMLLEGELENRRLGRAIGCFTVNTLTEPVAETDPEVARLLAKDLERRLDAFRAVIARGQRDGSVRSSRDPAGLAWYLTSVIAGMRIASQAGADRSALEQIMAAGVDSLAH